MKTDNMFKAFSMDKSAAEVQLRDGNFKQSLERYASSVSNDFLKHGLDMNVAIAKIASREHLNSDQIQRVVEESNNRVYLAKYAERRNSNDRDVVFERADSEKIAAINENAKPDMQKFASMESEPLNAYNATRNLTGAITPTVPMSITKLAAEKLAGDLKKTANDLAHANVAFDAHIYKVAEMLIRYDRAGVDTGVCFDEICRRNGLRVPVQEIIKKAAEEIIGLEKSAGKMNEDYRLDLPFVDLGESRKDYSLGEFSKIASMNLQKKPARNFPVMQIHGTLIKNLPDMVKFASQINDLFIDVKAKEEFHKKAEEAATFTKKAGEEHAE